MPSRRDRLLGWYHAVKYHAFRRERRPVDGRRGLVVLQIDALAYSDLRRALELGYCPTLTHLIRRHDFMIRRWFCGLPSATPYCQAGFFHGENDGIPAFRFYDKSARTVITCNAPHGVQYIRDRIRSPGALAGGSSYVNLLDGDAQTVGFTVATRERMSVWQRLGGRRMLLLVFLHPIRVARMGVQAVWEWLREEWERTLGEWSRRATHAEGVFPFVRILTNVVVRELQTMAVMLDVWLGVPIIYTTFMQYDELSHHFGPSSPQALKDLRRTDARIREIWRMIRAAGQREYDLVILSDHGSTPSASYRVRFGESLGATIQRRLDEAAGGRVPLKALASFAEDSEFADLAPHVVQTVAAAARPDHRRVRWMLRRAARWVRSRYGLRELLFPEKYLVSTRHEVVVTYSSCLAHVYFADTAAQLERQHLAADRRRAYLYTTLLENAGIGLLLTRAGPAVYLQSRDGRAVLEDGEVKVLAGTNPLDPYGSEPYLLRAVERLVRQPNAGDIVVFGAYDGYDIVSFDDQVGAHGCAGGDQVYPFVMAPAALGLADAALEDARDMHRELLSKYAVRGTGE
ncbi:MAG TPA: alkaline phosphatase family protein [Gemmatimonadaceae bacterium]|nr:alkaline phosphatase family protein [Gemmatimonadaceae bacterium]